MLLATSALRLVARLHLLALAFLPRIELRAFARVPRLHVRAALAGRRVLHFFNLPCVEPFPLGRVPLSDLGPLLGVPRSYLAR